MLGVLGVLGVLVCGLLSEGWTARLAEGGRGGFELLIGMHAFE